MIDRRLFQKLAYEFDMSAYGDQDIQRSAANLLYVLDSPSLVRPWKLREMLATMVPEHYRDRFLHGGPKDILEALDVMEIPTSIATAVADIIGIAVREPGELDTELYDHLKTQSCATIVDRLVKQLPPGKQTDRLASAAFRNRVEFAARVALAAFRTTHERDTFMSSDDVHRTTMLVAAGVEIELAHVIAERLGNRA